MAQYYKIGSTSFDVRTPRKLRGDSMEIRATLTAVSSKADSAGNRYWAFIYHDLNTDKNVLATISGGESNIYGILRHMYNGDDWDRSIVFNRSELKIREYNRFAKGLPYAGCRSEDLAAYIKKQLEA